MSDGSPDQDGRTVSFDDLVTAATVGVSRRPLPITGLDGPAAGHARCSTLLTRPRPCWTPPR